MIKTNNNLEYFYEEQETSERVSSYHRRVNLAWKYCTYLAGVVLIYAFASAWKQKRDMYKAAAAIAEQPGIRGGESKLREDGSIAISIDGKLIEIIPRNIE